MSDSKKPPCWSRRGFMKTTVGAAAAIGLAPVVGSGCASIPSEAFTAGQASTYDDSWATKVEDADIFILHSDEGYAAISAECTHMSCAVETTEGGLFECPCHGSVFGQKGQVMSGPAEDPLTWFKVEIKDGEVVVDPTQTVPSGTYTQA